MLQSVAFLEFLRRLRLSGLELSVASSTLGSVGTGALSVLVSSFPVSGSTDASVDWSWTGFESRLGVSSVIKVSIWVEFEAAVVSGFDFRCSKSWDGTRDPNFEFAF